MHAASASAATRAGEERLAVRLAAQQVQAGPLAHPPDLGLLCIAAPRSALHTPWTGEGGVRGDLRWRHVGRGIVLAELDVLGPRGARIRTLAWAIPDSVEGVEQGWRCGGDGLRPIAGSTVFERPGP